MFILFGFGRQTARDHGSAREQACGHCHNQVSRRLTKVTTWFTLFFIPVIPYRRQYLLICPICGNTQALSREEFEEIIGNPASEVRGEARASLGVDSSESPARQPLARPVSDAAKYAGKTPTQIAYLKKIEAHEQQLAAQEDES